MQIRRGGIRVLNIQYTEASSPKDYVLLATSEAKKPFHVSSMNSSISCSSLARCSSSQVIVSYPVDSSIKASFAARARLDGMIRIGRVKNKNHYRAKQYIVFGPHYCSEDRISHCSLIVCTSLPEI